MHEFDLKEQDILCVVCYWAAKIPTEAAMPCPAEFFVAFLLHKGRHILIRDQFAGVSQHRLVKGKHHTTTICGRKLTFSIWYLSIASFVRIIAFCNKSSGISAFTIFTCNRWHGTLEMMHGQRFSWSQTYGKHPHHISCFKIMTLSPFHLFPVLTQ